MAKVVKAKKVVRKPVEEYLKTQKRFRHLFKPKRQDAEIAAIQAIADRNAEKYGIDIKLEERINNQYFLSVISSTGISDILNIKLQGSVEFLIL